MVLPSRLQSIPLLQPTDSRSFVLAPVLGSTLNSSPRRMPSPFSGRVMDPMTKRPAGSHAPSLKRTMLDATYSCVSGAATVAVALSVMGVLDAAAVGAGGLMRATENSNPATSWVDTVSWCV
jgi:hypothetical protein